MHDLREIFEIRSQPRVFPNPEVAIARSISRTRSVYGFDARRQTDGGNTEQGRERERESKMRNPEIRARSCGYGAQAVVCMPTERLCIVRSRLSDGNV